MTKVLYQVWILENDEWIQAEKLYPTEKAALKDIEECGYAPDEYEITKIKKEIY